jgi:hypothetical protein
MQTRLLHGARSSRSPDAAQRHQRVYARLRRAISAFTRVFDALRLAAWCAAESRVPLARLWLPGSAEQREELQRVRDTRGARAAVVICPSGSFVSSPLCKNISVFTYPKSHLQLFASHPTRGAYHDRHGRGVECGGRGSVLRATGSQGGSMRPVSDHQASGREMLQRTAKSCGPDAPTLASSWRSCVGPTGLRQNLSADDGGKRARSPRRARHKR